MYKLSVANNLRGSLSQPAYYHLEDNIVVDHNDDDDDDDDGEMNHYVEGKGDDGFLARNYEKMVATSDGILMMARNYEASCG